MNLKFFSIIAIVLAACSSCITDKYGQGTFGGHRVSDSELRGSVFKIMVTQNIDTSSLVEMGLDKKTEISHSGTAWIAGYTKDRTLLITAGHVCPNLTLYKTGSDLIGDLPVIGTKMSLLGADSEDEIEPVEVISDDDEIDLCMISAPGIFGTALPIANRLPKYGATVEYAGAPHGHFGHGIAPIFDGRIAGRGYPFSKEHGEFVIIDTPSGPGASGSPVLYDGRVIGVIVAGYKDFWNEMACVPYDVIKKFEKDAMEGHATK